MTELMLAVGTVSLLLGYALTLGVRRYALAKAMVDVPNERSLHSVPTPRGGGLSIVVCSLAALGVNAATGLMTIREAVGYGIGGFAVAAVGFIDDHRSVRARDRAAVHFAAAGVFLYAIGGLPSLSFGAWTMHLGPAGYVLGALVIVWMINLYNFMDGIDGIAASEAVIVAALAAGLLLWKGATGTAVLCAAIAMSSLGFLVWNWSPAKIFMGDVGSGFLGFCFGALAVAGEKRGDIPLSAWVLLLGVFVADATLTLCRRIARRERFYLPHKSHAYQRAVASGFSHAQVTTAVIAGDLALSALTVALVTANGGIRALATLGVGVVGLLLAYGWVERRMPMRALQSVSR